jgi:putative transposase
MGYSSSEKLEVIHLVERSHLPVTRTLDKLSIPHTTFYRWYDRYQIGGPEGLEDQSFRPSRVWNRIPDDVRRRIVDLALGVPELSAYSVRYSSISVVIRLCSSQNGRWEGL